MSTPDVYRAIYADQLHFPRYGQGLDRCKDVLPRLRAWTDAHPRARILDVGCGHGAFVREIATWPSVILGVGVDAAICPDSGDGCRFESGDATALGFPDGYFDAVASFDVLEHLDVAAAGRCLSEMRRVAPRAVVAIANMPDPIEIDGREVELHLTQRPAEWWIATARSVGWDLIEHQRWHHPCRFFLWLGDWQ